jgi:hypothetical protein
MKNIIYAFALLISLVSYGQQSEDLVPKQAVSVFTINNINLLEKISLDELVEYQFMEEVQQEIFDGSTAGKTIKDTGFDFDQRFNVFFGKGSDFEISGFTFGISNKDLLFEVFDDFEKEKNKIKGVEIYRSYFNQIVIKGKSGLLLRVTPNTSRVNEITDSIWYARGNSYPWGEYEIYDELKEEVYEVPEDMETPENTSNPANGELPIADEDPTTKNYYELLDSVELVLQQESLKIVLTDLFKSKDNLLKNSVEFKEQLTHEAEAVFYFDNSRSIKESYDFVRFNNVYPNFYRKLDDLYRGNIVVGDLIINDNSIDLKMRTNYGDQLGKIYQELTNAPFDANVLKYIHKDHAAFFTYRLDFKRAYREMYDVVHPLLESEADSNYSFSSSLLFLELWDMLVDKNTLFDTYPGSMFGTYNGIRKVKTKKFEFEYDEETFEYSEREVEAEEDMPLFTIGFSTYDTRIPEAVLRHIQRTEKDCIKHEGYWEFENAILRAAPLFVVIQNGLFLFTNDEDLARNHSDGYGNDAIEKNTAKKANDGGFLYAYSDLNKAIGDLPKDMFSEDENELIDVIRGKSGIMEITTNETDKNHTDFNLVYEFNGESEGAGTYILDLINSFYVVSK